MIKRTIHALVAGALGASAVCAVSWALQWGPVAIAANNNSGLANWLALVAIPLNGAGLLLVWLQLRSNEKAVNASATSAAAAADAARIAATDARPWVKFDLPDNLSISVRGEESRVLYVRPKLAVQNIGRSPALEVSARFLLLINPSREQIDQAFQQLGSMPSFDHLTLFPGQRDELTLEHNLPLPGELHDEQALLRGVVLISYKNPINGGVCTTPFVAHFFDHGGHGEGLNRSVHLRIGLRLAGVETDTKHLRSPT